MAPRAEAAPALADTLARRCAWPDRPTVTVAVSGGADSLALLALARHVGLGVLAVHVDHGLRPGSAADAGVVAAAAARLGATFEARAVHVEPGPDLEARARTARYQALPYGVLTGHTADDQAETVLLNLLRGAGLDGLAGMRSAPGRVAGTDPAGPTSPVRPLLALRRQETRALCEALGLTPVEDPTNAALVHRRNAVRHRLLPLLAEIGQRDPVPVLDRQSALLADDAALLEALASAIDPTDAAALRDAPRPLARRAVRRWLRAGSDAEHHPPSAAEVARVLAVAAGDAAACELAGGRRVARRAGRLRLEEPVGRPRAVPVTPVGSTP